MKKLICIILCFAVFWACSNKKDEGKNDDNKDDNTSTTTDSIVHQSDSTFCYAGVSIKCKSILESEYEAQKNIFFKKNVIRKIENFEQVKSLLQGIAYWTDITQVMTKLVAKNGKMIEFSEGEYDGTSDRNFFRPLVNGR